MSTGSRACLYLRQSADVTGERLAVTRQRSDCIKLATRLGLGIVAEYEDNDTSASTGRRRPGYEQMLGAVERGDIDVVIAWHVDRLTRNLRDLEQLIDVTQAHAVKVATVSGDLDLTTDSGRLVGRILASVAKGEVERKSARQKLANLQRAEAGKPAAGRRAYGYAPNGLDVVPEEARVVREAFRRFLAGDGLRTIATDLNARGSVTSRGVAWTPGTLRLMLKNPRYAALRTHRGEVVGSAVWKPLVSTEDHHATLARLADPSRRNAVGPPRRYLLSGIARCRVCKEPLAGAWNKARGHAIYRCPSRRHVSRLQQPIDEWIEAIVVERLSRPDAVHLFASPERADEVEPLRREEARLLARLDDLSGAYAADEITREQLAAGSRRLRDSLTSVQEQMGRLIRVEDALDLVSSTDVGEAWRALALDRQRRIVRVLLDIEVAGPGRGGKRFDQLDPSTVDTQWKLSG